MKMHIIAVYEGELLRDFFSLFSSSSAKFYVSRLIFFFNFIIYYIIQFERYKKFGKFMYLSLGTTLLISLALL